LTRKKNMDKKLEEMIPAPAEAERNIRNAVEGQGCKNKRVHLTDALHFVLTFSCNLHLRIFHFRTTLQMVVENRICGNPRILILGLQAIK
jgi:hypothetical protein